MGQEEICQEMKKVLEQLSLEQQKHLLELAQAVQRTERRLEGGMPSGDEDSAR